jgi:hypothetical protein
MHHAYMTTLDTLSFVSYLLACTKNLQTPAHPWRVLLIQIFVVKIKNYFENILRLKWKNFNGTVVKYFKNS